MNPRRLLPYLVIFLVLAGAYAALQWRQEKQEAQEKAAKKLFALKEQEVGKLALIRAGQEVRLIKKDRDWELEAPLKSKADQATVDNMLVTLAGLERQRDLGVPKDPKEFGMDKPQLVVEFTAQGQSHRLAVGSQAPGAQNYYARKNQEPNVLLISASSKDSLDRTLSSLRDKTLLTFTPGEVKTLKIKAGKTQVALEKTGTQWRWTGRENFKVRADRVEALLRQLHNARIKDFPENLPSKSDPLGLTPQPRLEVTLATGKGSETLWLGASKDRDVYARKGADGPVVLVDGSLKKEIDQATAALEDRRLWGGPATEARKLAWGTPGKLWTAVKEKDVWKITGPESATREQSAARMELALWKLQNLEYEALVPQPGPASEKDAQVMEVYIEGDKPAFRLEVVSRKGDKIEVKARKGDQTLAALVPDQKFYETLGDLTSLAAPPPKPHDHDHD
jgi:hypothetical protein